MALPTPTTPSAHPPLDAGSIERRLRGIEEDIRNLQTNQRPQAFALGDLTNTRPLQAPADGQVPTWSKARGLWVPA